MLNDCPIIWKSTLQEGMALSTMMAEYYALSTAMRDVLPFRTVVQTVAHATGINSVQSTFKTTVHEDNARCCTLANLEPGRITARSKHYAIRTHWFRSHLDDNTKVVKIDTAVQKADILTKPLVRSRFEAVRMLLCGW